MIENSNIAFMDCMEDVPVVQAITECSHANTCWARWLAQYKKAVSHKLTCIKLHGGVENSYYYSNSVNYGGLVVN